jgi:hypothetical protein
MDVTRPPDTIAGRVENVSPTELSSVFGVKNTLGRKIKAAGSLTLEGGDGTR